MESSCHTKLPDLQQVVYFNLQLNLASNCNLCCQLLCSSEYSSAQTGAKGAFRQQLQAGLKEEGDFSQLIHTPSCFLRAAVPLTD